MSEAGLSREVDLATVHEHPERLVWLDHTAASAMPAAQVAEFQLAAVRKRFAELRERLPVLASLAREQGIDEIGDLNEAAGLLFKHSVYKSYPMSLIEKGRFDRITQWLQNLTTADLSQVDLTGVETIDAWMDTLLAQAGVRITHSTGTSGKLSFLPRAPIDRNIMMRTSRLPTCVDGQPEPTGLDKVPTIVFGQRTAYSAYAASNEIIIEQLFGGDESLIYYLDEGRLSADVLSLGGRLAAASNKGELGRDQISPVLLARLEEFREAQRTAPERRRKFYDRVFTELAGKRIRMAGNWLMYNEMMEIARERGLSRVFAPDSLVVSAGGTKGQVLPEGFKEAIFDFLGVDHVHEGYGMSEISGLMNKCSAGHYHAKPWMLVFLLDPKTGQAAPRTGTHTGRFGVIDLAMQGRWGGVLSGDEVTMSFDRCACGRDGPWIVDSVRRYSEMEGGDDKITCAGAPAAHDNALAFLAEVE